jgi:hypothetical protein
MRELRHDDLAIPLLDGWEDGTQVVIVTKPDQGFRPNLVVSQDPIENETAKEFAHRHLPMLKEALTHYELVSEAEIDLGPHSGFIREQSFTVNEQQLRQIQFYVIRGHTAYTMTFTHLAERFEGLKGTAESIFEQIRLGNDTVAGQDVSPSDS